jgi:hypothetical protein
MVFQAFMYTEAVVILLLPISTNLPSQSSASQLKDYSKDRRKINTKSEKIEVLF